MAGNLPLNAQTGDKTKKFFENYYSKRLEFTSNEVDAVLQFFEKRGFSLSSATSVSSILLQQAKIDDVKVFDLLDTLKGLSEVQLSALVAEILNLNREKTSSVGYRVDETQAVYEARNIAV